MNSRIYKVTVDRDDGSIGYYLVEATSQTQALLHVARSMIKAQIAKPKEIAALMASGIVLESAVQVEGEVE